MNGGLANFSVTDVGIACGPTRGWLQALCDAVARSPEGERVLAAAGRIIGFPSTREVSRYVERRGAFNTDLHLQHPTFPYAPMGNEMYRRAALAAVNGLDERYSSCDAPKTDGVALSNGAV